jgi:hypothetical protein
LNEESPNLPKPPLSKLMNPSGVPQLRHDKSIEMNKNDSGLGFIDPTNPNSANKVGSEQLYTHIPRTGIE